MRGYGTIGFLFHLRTRMMFFTAPFSPKGKLGFPFLQITQVLKHVLKRTLNEFSNSSVYGLFYFN